MDFLKRIVTTCFFLHYYIFVAMAAVLNTFKYAFKTILQQILKETLSVLLTKRIRMCSLHCSILSPILISTEDLWILNQQWSVTHCMESQIKIKQNSQTLSYILTAWSIGLFGKLVFSGWQANHKFILEPEPSLHTCSQGYDVWIVNNRGNRICKIDVQDEKYWSYTFDHMVEYDLPALGNQILKESSKQKMIYLGHSQGSTQLLVGLGIHESLRDKIACFIGLGTVVSIYNIEDHFLMNFLSRFDLLQIFIKLGIDKLLILPRQLSQAVEVLIYKSKLHYNIMMHFIRLICRRNLLNKIPHELFGVIITHEPGEESTKNALRWVQSKKKGSIAKFDFGKKENFVRYGTAQPPAYSLKHLKSNQFNNYIFRGMKDSVMSDRDLTELVAKFDDKKISVSNIPDYNHLDYLWSKSAKEDVYENLVEIIDMESGSK